MQIMDVEVFRRCFAVMVQAIGVYHGVLCPIFCDALFL